MTLNTRTAAQVRHNVLCSISKHCTNLKMGIQLADTLWQLVGSREEGGNLPAGKLGLGLHYQLHGNTVIFVGKLYGRSNFNHQIFV